MQPYQYLTILGTKVLNDHETQFPALMTNINGRMSKANDARLREFPALTSALISSTGKSLRFYRDFSCHNKHVIPPFASYHIG